MKYILLLLALFLCTGMSGSCRSVPVEQTETEEIEIPEEEETFPPIEFLPDGENLPVSVFGEIWAYVIAGREAALTRGLPISDIGYFGAEVNTYGALISVPNRRALPAFNGKVHLVVCCNGYALSHFALLPGSAERKTLIADLIAATKNFDGLQIDFENIPQRAGEAFFTFLSELRAGLGNDKMLTIALPARSRKINNDVYDYERIAPVVDRILVMAYDEHWSGSAPGPIASLAWCQRVASYSLNVIGREKLIMGLPFYGRAWGRPGHSQAYIYTGIERVIRENNVKGIQRENGIPTFDYSATISVKVYFEDAYSLSTRMEMYRSMQITKIGFWRLGQETPAVWKLLSLGE